MPSPQQVYPAVLACLQALAVVRHRTAQEAVAALLTALLVGQSLRPTALARALPSPSVRPARARYQQVARAWARPWLTAAQLSPALVAAALALAAPPGTPVLVVDSVRCGAWEVFTVGLCWHGRVRPLRWALLPYPWPRGQFTPTVCGLLRQVAAGWPAAVPAPHLVADRAFPSLPLFKTLDALGWGYTIRLRASDVVTTAAGPVQGYALLRAATPEAWTSQPGRFGRHDAAGATLLVGGRGVAVRPWHQRDGGRARHRARRQARRLHGVKQTQRPAPTEPWLILLTTHQRWLAAVRAYGQRSHTEGTYRDAQGGWDGRHGWDLGERLAAATTVRQVETLVGLGALGTLLQSWLGDHLTAATTPAPIRAVAGEWTVHGRLSVWARGRLALTDPSGRLAAWVPTALGAAAARIGRRAAVPTALAPPSPTVKVA